MGDLGLCNAGISAENDLASLPDILSHLSRSPSPLARMGSSSWYLCENPDLLVQHDSPMTLLPTSVSDGEIGSDIGETPFSAACIAQERQKQQSLTTPSRPESPASRLNGSTHPLPSGKLKETLENAIEKQDHVSTQRVQLQELRKELKYKKDEEGILRATLMKKLNARFAQNDDSAPPLSDFESLQLAVDKVQELEMNYNQTEDELELEEARLSRLMQKLSDMLQKAHTLNIPEDAEQSEYDSDSASSATSGIPPAPPSVSAYLARIGDMYELRETIEKCEMELQNLEDKKSTRERFGLPMDDESLRLLHHYYEEIKQLQSEISEASRDLDRLRAVCDGEGVVMDEYAKGIDIIHDRGLGDMAGYQTDPLKTSPVGDLYSFFEPGPSKLDQTTFINKWILQQLRQSSLEIRRLKSQSELRSLSEEGWDDANISRLALTMWYRDDLRVASPSASVSEDHLDSKDEDKSIPKEEAREPGDSLLVKRLATRKCNSDRYFGSCAPHRARVCSSLV